MTSFKTQFGPYLALVVGVIALAFSPFFVRWAEAPGPVTGFYRLMVPTIVLLPYFLIWLAKQPRPNKERMLLFPILSGVSTAFDLIFWTTSLFFTRVANATLLGNTAPLWVALVAWLLFRERLRGIFWIGLALTLIGAGTVFGGDLFVHQDPRSGTGDLLALASGIFYAGYFLAAQRGRQGTPTVPFFWLVNFFALITVLGFVGLNGMRLVGYPPLTWLAFLGAGLVTQLIGHFSVVYALGHLPASLVSPTLIGQPVLVALLAIPIANEHLIFSQWVGGVTVLCGIYLVHRSRVNSSIPQPEPVPPVIAAD